MAFKRDFLVVSFGRLGATLIALISIRAVTSFLSPEKYGELAILITVQMLCGLFLINPVGQHINLHTHAWWDEGTLIQRLKSYNLYIITASTLGSIVALAVTHPASPTIAAYTVAIVFMMVAAGTWNATLVPMLNMLGFRTASVGWSVTTAAAGLMASISFVFLWPTAIAWFAGQAVGMLVGAIGARYYLKARVSATAYSQPRLPLLNKKTVTAYCAPLAVAAGLMWVQLSGYRFAIEHYWGLAQLGFFAVGLQLAGQIWALVESLAIQFLYPFFFRRVSEHSDDDEVRLAVSDLLNTLLPAYLLLAGLTVLAAPYLLKLLVASEYSNAWQFVAVGAVIELCRASGNVLSNAAHVKRKTTSLALPYATGAAVILVFIVVAGTYKMDIRWAGLALIAGALLMLITMYVNMHKQVKFKLDRVRCSSAFFMMMGMACLVAYMPQALGWTAAIVDLLVISILGGGGLLVMLWRNPALSRLLNVQLRNS